MKICVINSCAKGIAGTGKGLARKHGQNHHILPKMLRFKKKYFHFASKKKIYVMCKKKPNI